MIYSKDLINKKNFLRTIYNFIPIILFIKCESRIKIFSDWQKLKKTHLSQEATGCTPLNQKRINQGKKQETGYPTQRERQ